MYISRCIFTDFWHSCLGVFWSSRVIFLSVFVYFFLDIYFLMILKYLSWCLSVSFPVLLSLWICHSSEYPLSVFLTVNRMFWTFLIFKLSHFWSASIWCIYFAPISIQDYFLMNKYKNVPILSKYKEMLLDEYNGVFSKISFTFIPCISTWYELNFEILPAVFRTSLGYSFPMPTKFWLN